MVKARSPFRKNPGSNLGLCKGFFFLSYGNFSPKIAYLSKNFTSGTRVPTRVPVVMARSSIRRVPGSNLGLCKGFFFLSYGNFSANLIGRGSTQSNIHGIGIAMECSDTSLRTLTIFDLPPSAPCLYLVSLRSAPWLFLWFSADDDIPPDSAVLKSLRISPLNLR